MKRGLILFLGLCIILLASIGLSQQDKKPRWQPSPHIAPTEARSPAAQLKLMKAPLGFEIQLVAAEPDIMNPMNIAFDAKGRLWVTMSSEYPFPTKRKKTKDTLKILDDFGPDGRARKITTFAENLNIPIGVLPLEDAKSAIVFSIPNVWLLEDTDGDGKADKKTVLLNEYGQRDTHGLTGEYQVGFDGWIYACHGYANTSTVRGRDGSAITMNSGNTYRFKPDGTKVNYHTHGQVNPFGLAFDPLGNLFSCDCHSQPIYQLLRGAWYPSFAKPHDGLGFGPPMMTNHHGSTAIAGIAYYAAQQFPKEFRGNIFIGNVTGNRINRDSLKRFGSTYTAIRKPDFVVSKDRWFRPVDIKLGPDGALYVADFYNRIIGHYEVPLTHPGRDFTHGRIWRIVYRGNNDKSNAAMRDWTTAKLEALIDDLADPNLTARMFATHQMVKRSGQRGIDAAIAILNQSKKPHQRSHALWILERKNALPNELLASAARADDVALRVHAMRVLAGRANLSETERKLAVEQLNDSDAFVQRQAAQALAAHPHIENIRPLLSLRYRVPKADTHLLHVARMALRNQLRPQEMWAKVNERNWTDRDIRTLAGGMLSLRNKQAAAFLTNHLKILKNRRQDYVRHIARHGVPAARLKTYATLTEIYAKDAAAQLAVLRAIHEGTSERGGRLDPAARAWATRLVMTLIGKRHASIVAAVDLAGDLQIGAAEAALQELLQNKKVNVELRRSSALALAKMEAAKHHTLLTMTLADANEPESLRQAVVEALAQVNSPPARSALVKTLSSAPASLQKHIATQLANSRDGADELLKAVAAGKASARLLQQRDVENRLRRANPPQWNTRLAKLTAGLKSPDARLLELLTARRAGFVKAKTSAARGVKLFEKNCAACHQIDNKGSKIAPQLDGIGLRGLDRLLEDILDSNRNVDQAFRSTTLLLKNGQIFTGLFLRQDGNVLILADEKGKEKRYEQNAVEQRIVTQTSPMPANFGEQMSAAELYDLVAFLLEQQTKTERDPLPDR